MRQELITGKTKSASGRTTATTVFVSETAVDIHRALEADPKAVLLLVGTLGVWRFAPSRFLPTCDFFVASKAANA